MADAAQFEVFTPPPRYRGRGGRRKDRPIRLSIEQRVDRHQDTTTIRVHRLRRSDVMTKSYIISEWLDLKHWPDARKTHWRHFRDDWRDHVLGQDWRKRRDARVNRRFEAYRTLGPKLQERLWLSGYIISFERAQQALDAAAYDFERALCWLVISRQMGRDATWSELKEALAYRPPREASP